MPFLASLAINRLVGTNVSTMQLYYWWKFITWNGQITGYWYFTEQKYFELERQQVADHSRLETEAKAAAELRWHVSDLGKYAVDTYIRSFIEFDEKSLSYLAPAVQSWLLGFTVFCTPLNFEQVYTLLWCLTLKALSLNLSFVV